MTSGIARALVKNVVKGKIAQGGSTITQQLIKNKAPFRGENLPAEGQRKVSWLWNMNVNTPSLRFWKCTSMRFFLEMGLGVLPRPLNSILIKNPEELNEAECALAWPGFPRPHQSLIP